MYQGFSKESGGIIGTITKGSETIDLDEAAETTSAEESLICQNEEGTEIALTAVLNSSNGDLSWCQNLSKEQIMRRTVAMTQMTSMLRDKDRNNVYESAIKVCIDNFIQLHQRAPVVLDIGSGTGLLSMLCLKHGAQFVIGIEMFEEMSRIAQEVICLNGAEDNILIINAKSTDIDSLPVMPDILVSELLDSALLGESVLTSHGDAISRLLSMSELSPIADRVIPNSAHIYATLIESKDVELMHNVSNISLGTTTTINQQQSQQPFNPWRSEHAHTCNGGWPLIPIHWKEYAKRGGRILSNATKILNFDFFHGMHNTSAYGDDDEENIDTSAEEGSENTYQYGEGCYDTDIIVATDGIIHGVLLWWKTALLSEQLDPQRVFVYSTEPDAQNWQDHWSQTVFPLAEAIYGNVGDVIRITAAHNVSSIWLTATVISRQQQQQQQAQQAIHKSVSGNYLNSDTLQYASVQDTVDTERSFIRNDETEVDECSEGKMFRKRIKLNNDMDHIFPNFNATLTQCISVTPRVCIDRLHVSECCCGWHLLCNTDRISQMNDVYVRTKWDSAIVSMLNTLYVNGLLQYAQQLMSNNNSAVNSVSGSAKITSPYTVDDNCSITTEYTTYTNTYKPTYNIIYDISDGSLNAISTAMEIKRTSSQIDNLNIHVISRETKSFSKFFFSQLAETNQLDDGLFVWEGGNFEELSEYFGGEDSGNDDNDAEEGQQSEEMNTTTTNDCSSVAASSVDDCMTTAGVASGDHWSNTPNLQIVCLMSECFQYQLTALPVWQAVSFWYQRTSLQTHLHPQAVIMPQQAYIMAAAFESDQLRLCHGKAGIVSGFDHAPLDARQSDWFTHTYPYKLGNYEKRILCPPVRIAAINYNHIAQNISQIITQTPFHTDGRCDFVAIWVDYQLTGETESTVECFHGEDFPSYLKVNLRYFEESVQVSKGSMLTCSSEFVVGESDFKLNFAIN